jgi:hypothetical protein
MSPARYFAGVLSLAVLAVSFAAASETKVEKVLVRGTGEALEVEIQTSGASVSPNTQAITGPDRIVVDFPGALPSSELHPLRVNQGAIKAIRSGLFAENPPTTRIVLDLTAPETYQVSTTQNGVIVKLGPGGTTQASGAATQAPARVQPQTGNTPGTSARLQNALLVSGPAIQSANISIERVPVTRSMMQNSAANLKLASGRLAMLANASQPSVTAKVAQPNVPQASKTEASLAQSNVASAKVGQASATPQDMPSDAQLLAMAAQAPVQSETQTANPQPAAQTAPPQPALNVSYQNGLLSIHAEKASLSQVLFEVQAKTQADIAIPAGAEQEQVVANLGPAPAKDVLSALLNGSSYNFIVMGDERALERVIISKKDPNLF